MSFTTKMLQCHTTLKTPLRDTLILCWSPWFTSCLCFRFVLNVYSGRQQLVDQLVGACHSRRRPRLNCWSLGIWGVKRWQSRHFSHPYFLSPCLPFITFKNQRDRHRRRDLPSSNSEMSTTSRARPGSGTFPV